jgi:hypothetical protein
MTSARVAVAVIGGRWNKPAQSAFSPMAETAAVSA